MTQDTSADKKLESRIKRALEGFAQEDNLSRSAKELFETLGFDVVNEVTELSVSFESLYKRVQNKEASGRFKKLLGDVEACYYAGSLVITGGEEFHATQSEGAQDGTGAADTQASGDEAGEGRGTAGGGADGTDGEERNVHFFAAQLKEGVHFTRGQTAELVRGFNRLMGFCPVVVAIRSTYATNQPPAAAGSPSAADEGGLQAGGVGGEAPHHSLREGYRAGETPFAYAKAGGAGEPPKGGKAMHTYMTLAVCERSAYSQEWRVGSKLGKVRLMADIDCCKVHRGHMDILKSVVREVSPLRSAAAVWEGLLRVFSVGLLTKRFYGELEDWYFWAVRSSLFPNDMEKKDDYTSDNRTAIIRLITRFIFVWFIKQKGLVNPVLFDPASLGGILKGFDEHSDSSGSYYNAIVQNLFFATLNQSIDKRGWVKENKKEASDEGKGDWHPSEHYTIGSYYRGWDLFTPEYAGDKGKDSTAIRRLFSQTPYVNGSLFDRLDGVQKEGRAYNLDGFSSHKKAQNGVIKRAFLPNSLFFGAKGAGDEGVEVDLSAEYGLKHTAHVRGLLEILKSYYFTAEENTPAEEAVALDPELLGRVFENLLGAYNPETAESARKDSGSFYTPRAIVDYMTAQSLLAYFAGACPDVPREVLEQLLEAEDAGGKEQGVPLSSTQCQQVIRAVYSCRVLDPACGSGAFPMGVLQRLVGVLRVVDKDNTHWQEVLVQRAGEDTKEALRQTSATERQERMDEITATFEKQREHPDYTRKLYVIQRCIHGVDIQPIAIQIAKLRFFVSLLCEQETNSDPADNYGIMALPNLETNLVAANTLVAKQKQTQGELESNETAVLRAQRDKVRAAHFSAHTKAKKDALEAKDKELSRQLADEMVKDGMYTKEEADEVVRWSPYAPDSSAPFFDAEWMFGTREFDLVIGNPPYIQLQKAAGRLGTLYEAQGYATFARTGDIYCLFYERGLSLCRAGGITCFITSNKWMRAGYGEATRTFLAEHNPRLLVDFGGLQVFESATVDTNILLVQNTPHTESDRTLCCTVRGAKSLRAFDLAGYVRDNAAEQPFTTSGAWTILSTLEQGIKAKIEAAGVPLKDWEVSINYGIKTGFNEAFIISTDKRDQILSQCKSKAERKRTERLIRKVLRGRDIRRYGYQWAQLWLINTHNGVCEKGIPRVDIKDYPAVKAHLDSFGGKLSKRQDQGDTPYNLRNCAYLEDFDKPKIVYPETTQGAYFAYDECDGIYIDKTCFMLSGDKEILAYLQATLSSNLFRYAYKRIFSSIELGEKGYQYNKHALIKLPIIPFNNTEQQKPIVDLVRQVLSGKAKGEDTTEAERQIDRLVCDLYGLTDAERRAIGFQEIT